MYSVIMMKVEDKQLKLISKLKLDTDMIRHYILAKKTFVTVC